MMMKVIRKKNEYQKELERQCEFRFTNEQASQKNPRNWGKPPRIDKLFDSRFEKK